ncbi:MAG: DUF1295 domain-containing protein [Bacteroidota bacterium]
MISAILDVGIILSIFSVFNFILSIILKRNDVADVGWGIGFVLVCIYSMVQFVVTPLTVIFYAMVITWGSRLAIHIGIRNSKKTEDFRYRQWRDDWRNTFYWRSFLQVYLLQMAILLIVALPILVLGVYTTEEQISIWHWIIAAPWLIGFLWESIADYQLAQFKTKRVGKIMSSGLWQFSRHPNYFGEVVMWWALFLYVFITHQVYYLLVSPLLLTYLLLRVSGIPMLEEKYKNDMEYRKYAGSVPAIWPLKRLINVLNKCRR